MSMKTLEAGILRELRTITKRSKLKSSEFLEWNSSESNMKKNVREGEEVVYCPEHGVWCIVSSKK